MKLRLNLRYIKEYLEYFVYKRKITPTTAITEPINLFFILLLSLSISIARKTVTIILVDLNGPITAAFLPT